MDRTSKGHREAYAQSIISIQWGGTVFNVDIGRRRRDNAQTQPGKQAAEQSEHIAE